MSWPPFAPLENTFARLEPLEHGHREKLRAAADDMALWRWYPDRGDGGHFDAFFDVRLQLSRAGTWQAYTIIRRDDGQVVGQTCFLAIVPEHLRLEIGGTWYCASAQGGAINPACKLLLLDHAFQNGAERVELKTDSLNARSRAAIAKLGAQQEGIFRAHMRMWDGHVRDTVYYSLLRAEWPAARARLQQRLEYR